MEEKRGGHDDGTLVGGPAPARGADRSDRAWHRGRLADDDLDDAAPPRPAAQKKTLKASEQDRPDVATRRKRWRIWQRPMSSASFVVLDETGATTAMISR
jgi:hypothetical protein